MGKTYSIRKVGVCGGGGSSLGQADLWKKKSVLISFPHSATPLGWMWVVQIIIPAAFRVRVEG